MDVRKTQGFTLIELLVVIAIIGILASVVLASLNSARESGGDAAVKSNLAQIRAQAELAYTDQGCYGDADGTTTCADWNPNNHWCNNAVNQNNTIFNEPRVENMILSAVAAGGDYHACRQTGGGTAWAIAVGLSDPAKAWCVDSYGVSRELTLPSAADSIHDLDAAVNDAGHTQQGGNTRCNPNY